MARRRKIPPASSIEIERRIRNVLRFLPMGIEDLRANVVLHPEDAEKFDAALKEARESGVVVRDKRRPWLRIA